MPGRCREALKEALAYAKTRKAFSRPIGSFQHNAFKLAEMATEVELAGISLTGSSQIISKGRILYSGFPWPNIG